MSNLICASCGKNFGEYNEETDKIESCDICGSNDLKRILYLKDSISFHENIKGKSNKMPGKKKPYSEFQGGEEWSVSKKCYVDKTRQIDREHDMYHEIVSEQQTGEIIHECHEPLSEHFGHGSAKYQK